MAVLLAGLVEAGPTAQGGRATELAARLRAYVAEYEGQIGSVVAEEDLIQLIRGGSATRRRHLISEVGFLRLPGDLDWIGHRSVRSMDGRRVRLDAKPLSEVLSQSGAPLREQALAIAAENARYNLGFSRTINLPTLPLDLLHPRRRDAFTVSYQGTDRQQGRVLERLRFLEREPGRIIAASATTFNRAQVDAWIQADNGALLRAHVTLRAPGRSVVENQFTIVFEPSAALEMLVPVKMTEIFYANGYGSGEATYTGFKRFATAARIVPEP
jgi:hypothetical protein